MMINHFKNIVSRNLINIPGFRTNRKIIVFESDDWGSIRMPSNEVFEELKKSKISVDKSPYCKFDSLESNSDMLQLFELLGSFKDFRENHPVITANTVVANPDFEKIKESSFENYFYEPFTETLKKYPNHDRVYEYYKEGIYNKIFFPQFHGREHVNVELWMTLLRNNKDFQFAFERNLWGLSNDVFPGRKSIQATFDSHNKKFLAKSVIEGLDLFEKLFQYKSRSFIANNFIWSEALEKTLAENEVKHLQGMKYQKLPKVDDNPNKLLRHHLGEKNIHDQIYSIRNCSFEPTIDGKGHEKTISEIKNAFLWLKPAVISTHRINFMGSLDESNRNKNIAELRLLLTKILINWPQAEFMTSMELDSVMRNN